MTSTPVRQARLPQSDQPPHAPNLSTALNNYQDAVVRLHEVDPITTELVRLRCARQHQCFT